MKLDALDHPKTLDFAARLNVELPTAIGHLELFWAFVGKKSPQGNIGKWPDGAIARACYWMAQPELFISALVGSGFIDTSASHRLLVHDWPEHAPRWVRSKLKTLGTGFIVDASPPVSRDTSPDVSADSKGSEEKCSEGKGSKSARDGSRATRLPADFSLTPERRAVAEAERLPADRTFEKFCNYWRAASGAKARKHDWDATWRNWCLTEADRSRGNGSTSQPRPTRYEQVMTALDNWNPDDTRTDEAPLAIAGPDLGR